DGSEGVQGADRARGRGQRRCLRIVHDRDPAGLRDRLGTGEPAQGGDVSSLRESNGVKALRAVIIVITMVLAIGPVLYGVLLSLRPFAAVLNDPLDIVPAIGQLSFEAYTQPIRSAADGGCCRVGVVGTSLI